MFTGLIETTGRLIARTAIDGGMAVTIASAMAAELAAGDSVAVNGVCLTVVTSDPETIRADLGPETIRATTLGAIEPGTVVNLERPLLAGGRMGGHFVQGHVDAVGAVVDRRPAAEFEWVTVAFPAHLAPYLVPKGSIAVDGISLTVAELLDEHFDVQVVPYTLEHTNLRFLNAGDRVNLECDVVGKYVVRAAELAGLSLLGVGRAGHSQ